jgi:hypothetical protein
MIMGSTILFRESLAEEGELNVCQKYFNVVNKRSALPNNNLIIGRYSVLPYYKEIEDDLPQNSDLINSYFQHRWIANFEYYKKLKDFTPQSWFFNQIQNISINGPFIVKGTTNSKKWQWNTKMFAESKVDAIKIALELQDDTYIGDQNIIIREYIPLKTLEIGVNGIRFANEWRFFCFKDKILAYGYYWSCADEDVINNVKITQNGIDFVGKLCNIIKEYVNFYVVDIAQTESGEWILIELNDGQMSGLSLVDPEILYKNLSKELKNY